MTRTRKDTKKYKDLLADELNAYDIGGIPSCFKKIKGRSRKAKIKQVLKNFKDNPELLEDEIIPEFRKTNAWDWY